MGVDCLVGMGRLETCLCVGLCAGPVGWRRWVRTGHPLRSCVGLLGSASPFAGRKGTVGRPRGFAPPVLVGYGPGLLCLWVDFQSA